MFENNMLNIFSMCQVQGCGKPLATKPETSTKGFALSVRVLRGMTSDGTIHQGYCCMQCTCTGSHIYNWQQVFLLHGVV